MALRYNLHRTRKAGALLVAVLMVVAATWGLVFPLQTAHAASAVSINGSTQYQTIDGFGASEAFGEASSMESSSAASQMLNLLFSTSSGAGLSIVRNLLPSDSNNTIEPNAPSSPTATPTYRWDGSSEGQVWFSQQAKSYGVSQIYGDAWSAPGYMKTNGSESNGGTICGLPGASCSSGDWRQAYANYLVQYIKDYQSDNINLTGIAFENEPNYTASYSSMNISPSQSANFADVLGPTLASAGLNTPIICCEPTGWNLAQSYASAITSDPTANSYVKTISSHGYSGAPNSPLSGLNGQHVWETEWSTFENFDPAWDDGTDASGFSWAQNIYTGLTAANLNAFFYWWGATTSTDNEGLIEFSGSTVNVAARLWAFANYSRFIRPGAVRIGATSGDSNLDVSAYKNTNGTVSIVVLNTSSSAITATYSLSNTGVADGTAVTPYLTNGSNNTAQQAATSISGGAFSATIPARSLVTYVLSGTGGVTPTVPPTVTPTPPTVTPTPTQGTGACSVHYAIASQWQGGFQAALTITNTSTTAINGWSLGFSFPNGQTITQLWNGSYTQSGSAVTITNASYNASIPAGATLSSPPGFLASWNGTNSPPTAFTLNGASCTVV
jgi:glucuronoarabinoxylan endo-1,4-beta-xylanase